MNLSHPDARDRKRSLVAPALPLARHASIITIVSGGLFTVAQLFTFVTMNRVDLAATLAGWPYRVSALALLIGFAGLLIAAVSLYEQQAANLGRLGTVGLCTTLVGTLFLGGDYWFETFAVPWYAVVLPDILAIPGAGWLAVGGVTSYLLFGLGWLLFAVASLRARVFPRFACLALMLGAILGFFAASPPFGAVLGIALLLVGITAHRTPKSRDRSGDEIGAESRQALRPTTASATPAKE